MTSNLRSGSTARFRNLAAGASQPAAAGERLVLHQHCRGAVVSIAEWRCTSHEGAGSVEEWTDAFEVVVPRHGAFEWDMGGERLLADAGSATFLHPAEPYRVRHPLGGGDSGAVFRTTRRALAALVARHDPAAAERDVARVPVRQVALDGPAYLLQRLAVRAARGRSPDVLEAEERALVFLEAVIERAFQRRDADGGRPVDRTRRRAREYAVFVGEVVAARYREPLTLGEVARVVGVSPYHLSRLVTSATGVPIYRMVLRRRLREALELVLETREGLSRIALAVGFGSHSHFTDAFRREFGLSPQALRRAGGLAKAMLTAPRR
jgi:AraC family transcriptional regulator